VSIEAQEIAGRVLLVIIVAYTVFAFFIYPLMNT